MSAISEMIKRLEELNSLFISGGGPKLKDGTLAWRAGYELLGKFDEGDSSVTDTLYELAFERSDVREITVVNFTSFFIARLDEFEGFDEVAQTANRKAFSEELGTQGMLTIAEKLEMDTVHFVDRMRGLNLL